MDRAGGPCSADRHPGLTGGAGATPAVRRNGTGRFPPDRGARPAGARRDVVRLRRDPHRNRVVKSALPSFSAPTLSTTVQPTRSTHVNNIEFLHNYAFNVAT